LKQPQTHLEAKHAKGLGTPFPRIPAPSWSIAKGQHCELTIHMSIAKSCSIAEPD